MYHATKQLLTIAVLIFSTCAACFVRAEPVPGSGTPALAAPSTPVTPTAPNPFCVPMTPAAASEWTGNFQAQEWVQAKGFPPQIMKYQALVSRDADGRLRAEISIEGHLNLQRMVACGEVRHQLILHLVTSQESNPPNRYQVSQPVLTLEHEGRRWMMGFPGFGSYLLNKPFIAASRLPLK